MGMTNLLLVIPNDELECVGGEFCEEVLLLLQKGMQHLLGGWHIEVNLIDGEHRNLLPVV